MRFRPSRHAYGCSTPCTCAASGYGATDKALPPFGVTATVAAVLLLLAVRSAQ